MLQRIKSAMRSCSTNLTIGKPRKECVLGKCSNTGLLNRQYPYKHRRAGLGVVFHKKTTSFVLKTITSSKPKPKLFLVTFQGNRFALPDL